MDLVYGPFSSLGMNCEVNFVCCYTDSPISGLTQCSYVDVSSLDLVVHGCTLYGSSSSRMSTRRLPVILCFSFRVHIISCYVLLGVSMVAEEVCYLFAPSGVSLFDVIFIVFSLLSSSRHLHRLSNKLSARDLLGLWCSLIILLH